MFAIARRHSRGGESSGDGERERERDVREGVEREGGERGRKRERGRDGTETQYYSCTQPFLCDRNVQ